LEGRVVGHLEHIHRVGVSSLKTALETRAGVAEDGKFSTIREPPNLVAEGALSSQRGWRYNTNANERSVFTSIGRLRESWRRTSSRGCSESCCRNTGYFTQTKMPSYMVGGAGIVTTTRVCGSFQAGY
jgi:hypothetical protein